MSFASLYSATTGIIEYCKNVATATRRKISIEDKLSPSIAAGVFVVYALGACPTIYVGDSGELAAAVHTLGIPHPSGYPLYVLLGKLWTVCLPVGSIALRLSLFSAASAAAAVGVLCWLCRRWEIHAVAVASSMLLVAFSPSFWSQANIQRVYSLNALFVALATVTAFFWYRRRRVRHLVFAFSLCGLGATNHTFMAIFALALVAFIFISEPVLWRRPSPLFCAAGGFAVGLLPYVYLPLRSLANPRLDWGNPETLQSLFNVVLRREFWSRSWSNSAADSLTVGADYAASLGSELLWIGTALAIVGAVIGRRRGWPVLLPLLVMAANLAIVGLHGSRNDIFIWHRYYIPSYLMVGVLAAMGGHAVLERLPRRLRFLPLVVPLVALLVGWRGNDRRRYRIAEDFSRTLLETLPPGAHLSASDDNILFVLIYLHLVEGLRPDVNLILQGVAADLPPLRFDPDREPLFFTHHPNWDIPELETVPVGMTYQIVRSGRPPPPPVIPKLELDGENDPRVPKDYLTRNLIGHFHFMLGAALEKRDWPRAWHELKASEAVAPSNDVLFYNLGLIYHRNGLFQEALAAFEHSHRINPRQTAGRSRVSASNRAREIREDMARIGTIEKRIAAELLKQGVRAGSATFHQQMAQQLDAQEERPAAHGHRLRAELVKQ